MRIGLGIPHLGHFADPAATRAVAIAAEHARFDSLWAMDRLLAPLAPRTLAYPGRADGTLPVEQQRVLDPLITLTLAASVTDRIRLGTDVLVAPWYAPVLLARSLAALDQVSGGRLTVGLGLGWSVDEFEAVGAPMSGRGARIDEILDVLAALWTQETSSIDTTREHIAASVVGVKPAQAPHPPVLLAATNPAGLDRIARRGDGWIPFGMTIAEIDSLWGQVRRGAERYGRDPDALQLVVRADPSFSAVALGRDRPVFSGSQHQVIDDIDRVRAIGATELILDLQTSTCSVDELLDTARLLRGSQPALIAA